MLVFHFYHLRLLKLSDLCLYMIFGIEVIEFLGLVCCSLGCIFVLLLFYSGVIRVIKMDDADFVNVFFSSFIVRDLNRDRWFGFFL